MVMASGPEPGRASPAADCALCPRLAAFRTSNRRDFPLFFNAPVPAFGDAEPLVLIVGLAPGLKGANRTGRPFTGDHAGMLLYSTLRAFGFSRGTFAASPDDGLELIGARVSNAVKCVPPRNKPLPVEVRTCGRFLTAELAETPSLKVILALGHLAHGAVLDALGMKRGGFAFAHGVRHRLPNGLMLFDSYHCSRYNTNTGVLTEAMFHAVFAGIVAALKSRVPPS